MARVCSGGVSRDLGLGVETATRGKVETEVELSRAQGLFTKGSFSNQLQYRV